MREIIRIVLLCVCAVLLLVHEARCEDDANTENAESDAVGAKVEEGDRKDGKGLLPGTLMLIYVSLLHTCYSESLNTCLDKKLL